MRLPGAVYDFDKKGKANSRLPSAISRGFEESAADTMRMPATGAKDALDGKPEHELPYTPEGRRAFLANKPTFGVTQVEAAITNDPVPGCNPQGFPRIVLHNFRTSRIVQTPENVLVLYEFNRSGV